MSIPMSTAAHSTALDVTIERPLPSYAMPSCRPIERIPPETLSNIFTAFMPDNPPKAHDCNSPVVLACVCRRWRDIALSTPQLWTSFHLMLVHSTIHHDKRTAKTWPSRSGALPLTIKLGFDQAPWFYKLAPEASDVLAILFPHAHRWRKLICRLDCELLAQFHHVRGHLSSLEHLDFEATYDSGTVTNMIDAFDQASCLAHLTLNQCSDLEEYNMPLTPRWQDLKRLDVRFDSSEELMATLYQCRSLEHLQVRVPDWDVTVDRPPLILPRLHTFQLKIGTSGYAFDLMDDFAFPSLRNVSLYVAVLDRRYNRDEEESCAAKFISLLNRSQCPIQTFSLGCDHTGQISENDLLNYLHALPAIHELRLVECVAFSLGEQALSRLTESTGDKHSLVPELRVLEIPWLRGSFLDEPFAAMVESRWKSSAGHRTSSRSLRAVRIKIDAPDDLFEPEFDINTIPATMRVLSRCSKEGMDVSVTETYKGGKTNNWFWFWNLAQELDI
ncbi:hypothetical protein FIBSPDRAFT_928435 [Athelia psychrophila]|uniref:F-box domain-containing protein n=1 Tax=Athelia psychrophila TaxID=1759441 RepID=A0A166Q4Y9_9AGAM|nr:hypothetical protein FIBSPDRAFT_928435 [Fibularhizoctonia sp. CBS 109695]